ncbi:MFS general substrate transporter [Xylona heveae TC161]|uniref:MFS general substrate transporter n=1 Tax=Xylona heveae (strain CBS 132557 / TC161) TaxID=1328760 RepID=A0A164ZGJ2_XYLHT|nr:MFS general substrate transporter [Xylona heveae TC161]KZF19078.1 MFS general substrate transporter [Xylona heveae TC161]
MALTSASDDSLPDGEIGRSGTTVDIAMDRPQSITEAISLAQFPSRAEKSKGQSVAIVAASFTIIFTCCGLNFAFGVYQALYETLARQPGTPFTGASPAEIDLIGTLCISLMTIGAPFVVAWAKRFSPRHVSFAGGLIFGVSLVLASFGKALWHFELTQGLLCGIGTCLSYMVAVTTAPTWFTSHRGLAMGVILSGTGVGGLVWAPALNACINSLGFRNTLRLTGAVSFALVSIASAAITWEPTSKARFWTENNARTSRADGILKVPLVDIRVARTRKFAAQALGAIFQSAAYYTPVFFFASYARSLGYGDTAGANFIALSNACNAVGKIVIGYAADRIGRLNTLFITTLFSAIAAIGFWLPSTMGDATTRTQGLFVTFVIFYGIFASAYVALFPTSLIEIFGAQNFASVNGVLYMVRGMATMVGTPVGGVLTRNTASALSPKTFEGMSILVSVLLFAASAAVLWVRMEAMVGPSGIVSWKWRQ